MTYTVACIFSTVVLGFLFKQFAGKDVRISKIILINYLICALIGILQMGFVVFDFTQFGSGIPAVVIGILFVAGFNAFGNGEDRIIMLPPGFEITKTGKEIKSILKVVTPKRQTHIMHKKIEMIVFKLFGIVNTVGRDINTGNSKS